MAEILRVEDLTKYFATKKGTLHEVDGVTFGLREGQTLGIVGESGCGKSTLGRVILHLHQRTGGRIIFQGKDISDVTKAQLKELRKDMQIIFQDPYASLNPRMSIGDIIAEPLKIYKLCNSKEEQQKKVREIMDVVGLAERTYGLYPHELDGGRRQRVGIARALILALIGELKKRGSRCLTLEVRASNDPARTLYESLGFAHVGTRRNCYQHRKADALILRKEWEI